MVNQYLQRRNYFVSNMTDDTISDMIGYYKIY
jgi:hypothetical protein